MSVHLQAGYLVDLLSAQGRVPALCPMSMRIHVYFPFCGKTVVSPFHSGVEKSHVSDRAPRIDVPTQPGSKKRVQAGKNWEKDGQTWQGMSYFQKEGSKIRFFNSMKNAGEVWTKIEYIDQDN